ncbi:hypothetical protein [Pseudomonas putida]|nr:hypothetical protein [Pseudomonas putida]MCG3644430.1 hypothetical protein [Pseudomonas putida]
MATLYDSSGNVKGHWCLAKWKYVAR